MMLFFYGFAAGAFLAGVIVFLMRGMALARVSEQLKSAESLLESERITKEKLQGEFRQAAVDTLWSTANQVKSEAGQTLEKQEQTIANSVADMKTRFDETQKIIKKFEEERAAMNARLEQSIGQVLDAGQLIRLEASTLKKALTSNSGVRGVWGQNVLQQILEQSGLVNGINFDTQATLVGDTNNDLRPDFVIKLPGGHFLAVDAKEVSGEYVLAQETEDADRQKQHYAKLTQNIRNNMTRLSRKEYQQYLDPEIPFVVMFIPSEAAIRAALATDPEIFEDSRKKRVFLASPMTIIPLIHLIVHSANQQQVANNARELAGVVDELGNKLRVFVNHLNDVRAGLQKASDAWNSSVGSWQRNVSPQIEKTKSLGGSLKDIEEIETLSSDLRQLPH